jgi:hypothetical protein
VARLCLVAVAAMLGADEATAEKTTRFELSVTLGVVEPALDTQHESRFTPPFQPGPYSGSAG